MSILRIIGLVALVVGFFGILLDQGLFGGIQYGNWIWHSKNLPEGEMIPREAAIGSMRDLSLKLNRAHRATLAPALLMLFGGLAAGLARPRRKESEQCGPENPIPSGTSDADASGVPDSRGL